jgi:hypothetical protein
MTPPVSCPAVAGERGVPPVDQRAVMTNADPGDTRAIYLEAAEQALALIAHQQVAERWPDDSSLLGMTVGQLASHLARSILQVEWFLAADVSDGPTIGAYEYFAGPELTDRESRRNVSVRERSTQTATLGHAAVLGEARLSLERLRRALGGEPRSRLLEAFGRVLLLDDYLRTRVVEILIHCDDLALSVDLPVPGFAPAANTIAIDVLVGAARRRHGDSAVLRALARRERDAVHALRVL